MKTNLEIDAVLAVRKLNASVIGFVMRARPFPIWHDG